MIKSTVLLSRPHAVTLTHAIKTHYEDFEELFVSIGELAYKYLFDPATQKVNYVAFNFGYTIKFPAPLTSGNPDREWHRKVGFDLLHTTPFEKAIRVEVKEGVEGFNVIYHLVPSSPLDGTPPYCDFYYRRGV
jgi:hypothetical protein